MIISGRTFLTFVLQAINRAADDLKQRRILLMKKKTKVILIVLAVIVMIVIFAVRSAMANVKSNLEQLSEQPLGEIDLHSVADGQHRGNYEVFPVAVEVEVTGHQVTIEEITIEGKIPAQPGKFEIINAPEVDNYDALIFGAPVQAFSLNPVMKKYMRSLPKMEGKKIALFVTKQIPVLWLGGTGAISFMKKESELRGARVMGSKIVVWAGSRREQSINEALANLSKLFPS
ncbi:MAG: hypothetical protein AVO34_04370 [Firmicutes bacterium ML8_F2]|nr:MAG: hypothetical protein AVO34_04370 [Firmicutes bacterium ML8_F2]